MSSTTRINNADQNEIENFELTNLNLKIQKLIDTPLPNFDTVVETRGTRTIHRPELDTPYGTYWQRDILMSDGQRHQEFIGISTISSSEPKQLAINVPAWGTRPDEGMNKIFNDKLHRAGFHTLTKAVPHNKRSSLYRGSHDVHASLDFDDGFSYTIDQNQIILHGESNGAMHGAGAVAYCPDYRNINDTYFIDPCIVRRPNLQEAKKLLRHPSYPIKEIMTIGRNLLNLSLKGEDTLKDYSGTIGSSREYIIGNLLVARALFSGEFGHIIAKLPANQIINFVIFNHSIANQKQELKAILKQRADKGVDVNIIYTDGVHASLMDPKIVDAKLKHIIQPKKSLKIIA